jgi:hypothetical protein
MVEWNRLYISGMREEEDDDIIVGEEINFLTKAKQSSWWACIMCRDFDF